MFKCSSCSVRSSVDYVNKHITLHGVRSRIDEIRTPTVSADRNLTRNTGVSGGVNLQASAIEWQKQNGEHFVYR